MTVHLGIGIVSIVAFSFFFPCNLMIVWTIATKRRLRKLWAYVIIFHTAILDVGYILPILTTGLMSLLGIELPKSIVVGSYYIMTAFPATQAALNLSLAVNRMIIFMDLRRVNKAAVYCVLLAFSWMAGVVWIVLTALIKANFRFDLVKHTLLMMPVNSQENRYQSQLNTAKMYLTMFCFGTAFFCYLITIYAIFRKVRVVNCRNLGY
uniref:G_PROTEIN_RECEP_F1_2 domain-containing protein n=1 Tax=Steinernema glaseri TaxID=37863 RepID=A0A1I8A6T5_9BILA